MKFQRMMLVALVLLAVLTIGAVSASDDALTNQTIDDSDEGVLLPSESNVVSENNGDSVAADVGGPISDDDILQASDESSDADVLGDDGYETIDDYYSFNYLQHMIPDGADGGKITLDHDYFGEGKELIISRSLTIDGNGFKLDAKYLSSIISIVDAKHVTLKDITFINWYNSPSAAIFGVEGCELSLVDCTFEGCLPEGYVISDHIHGSGIGNGAVYMPNSVCTFENCNFNICHGQDKGILYMPNSECSFVNCSFEKCNGDEKGALYVVDSTCSFVDCKFRECENGRNGVFNFENANITFNRCTFEKNWNIAQYLDFIAHGGSYSFMDCNFSTTNGLYITDALCYVVNSSFTDIHESDYAALHLSRVNGFVDNSTFVRTAGLRSSAIAFVGDDCHVNNCRFIECHSEHSDATAIYMSAKNCSVSGCDFTGSDRVRCVEFNNAKGFVSDCNFTDTVSDYVVYFKNVRGSIDNCNFNRWRWENAIYCSNVNGSINNCYFKNKDNCSFEVGDGSGIYCLNFNGIVNNCSFFNVMSAIQLKNSHAGVDKCTFENVQAFAGGSCVNVNGGTGSITNSRFVNGFGKYGSFEFSTGGAIYSSDADCILNNCDFIGCYAGNGGAIYFKNRYGCVTNCNFTDCFGYYGGAVYFDSNGNIINCSFNNCSAIKKGGAAYYNSNAELNNSYFADCYSNDDGGAVYCKSGAELNDSSFVNCSSDHGGAIFFAGEGGGVLGSYFENCFADKEGGAISSGKIAFAEDCTFKNCYISTSTSQDAALNNVIGTACDFDNDDLKLISFINLILKKEYDDEDVVLAIDLVDENGEGIDDVVYMSIDGIDSQVSLVNGSYDLKLSDLTLGRHNISVQYLGDENHYASEDASDFFVRTCINITAQLNNTGMLFADVPVSIAIGVGNDLVDYVSYQFDASEFNENGWWEGYTQNSRVEVTDGQAFVNSTYPCGYYTYTFKIDGNPYYYSNTVRMTLYVYSIPIRTGFMFMTFYGEDGQSVMLSDLFGVPIPNATISYTINNVTSAAQLDGYGTMKFSNFTEACDIFVEYGGNETYLPCNGTLHYTVAPTFDVKVGEITIGRPLSITITCNDDINGQVYLYISDVNYSGRSFTVNITGGHGEINITYLDEGTYNCYVSYWGNEKYSQWSTSFILNLAHDNITSFIDGQSSLHNYFDENGVMVTNLDELIFNGEFRDLTLTINKPVTLNGQNATFINTNFIVTSDDVAMADINFNYSGDIPVISVDGVSNFKMEGNVIVYNGGGPVISVDGVSDFRMEGNVIDYVGMSDDDCAVTVLNSHDVSIIDNLIEVRNANAVMISAENFNITHNYLIVNSTERAFAIHVKGTSIGVVRDNNIDVMAQKIVYSINTDSSTGEIRVNYINNTINAKAYFSVGIYDDSELIKDNRITLSGNYAIGIVVLSNADVDGNEIILDTSNTGSEDIQDPIGVETAGIKVNNDATITKNNIESSSKSISIVGGSSTISDNILVGQVSVNSNGNEISNNVIISNEDYAIDLGDSVGNTIDVNDLYADGAEGNGAVKANNEQANEIRNNNEEEYVEINIEDSASVYDIDAVDFKVSNSSKGVVVVKIGDVEYLNTSITNLHGPNPDEDDPACCHYTLGPADFTSMVSPGTYSIFCGYYKNGKMVTNQTKDVEIYYPKAEIEIFTYRDELTNPIFEINSQENITGHVAVAIGGSEIFRADVSDLESHISKDNRYIHSFSFADLKLDEGNYSVAVKYNGTKGDILREFDITVEDNAIDPNFSIAVHNVEEGNPVVVNVSAHELFTGDVLVVINDTSVIVHVENGFGTNSTVLTAGKYLATLNFTATGSYLIPIGYNTSVNDYEYANAFKSGSAQKTFIVSAKAVAPARDVTVNGQTETAKATASKVKPTLTAKKATFKAKKTKKYTVTLKDGKKAIKKAKITIKVKGKTYKATTNAKGKATFNLKKLTKKGKYTAVVKFAGNSAYYAVSKKVKITVK